MGRTGPWRGGAARATPACRAAAVAVGWSEFNPSRRTGFNSTEVYRGPTRQQRTEAEPDDRVHEALAADARTGRASEGGPAAAVHERPDRRARDERPRRVQGRPRPVEGDRRDGASVSVFNVA